MQPSSSSYDSAKCSGALRSAARKRGVIASAAAMKLFMSQAPRA